MPELLLRKELHRRGLRYRLRSVSTGKPDLVFVRPRIAVFVDGDMWHGHGWSERGFATMEEQFASHRDPDFWVRKIRRNVERDVEVNELLAAQGWRVMRLLESHIRRDLMSAADMIETAVRQASVRLDDDVSDR